MIASKTFPATFHHQEETATDGHHATMSLHRAEPEAWRAIDVDAMTMTTITMIVLPPRAPPGMPLVELENDAATDVMTATMTPIRPRLVAVPNDASPV